MGKQTRLVASVESVLRGLMPRLVIVEANHQHATEARRSFKKNPLVCGTIQRDSRKARLDAGKRIGPTFNDKHGPDAFQRVHVAKQSDLSHVYFYPFFRRIFANIPREIAAIVRKRNNDSRAFHLPDVRKPPITDEAEPIPCRRFGGEAAPRQIRNRVGIVKPFSRRLNVIMI